MGNPGCDELEAMTALRISLPEMPILALTSNEVPGQEQAALKAGACAVLTKTATRTELIGKLREVWNHSDAPAQKEEVKKEISSLYSSHHELASRMADLHILRRE
jgi:CheY-like chemotaxis protein